RRTSGQECVERCGVGLVRGRGIRKVRRVEDAGENRIARICAEGDAWHRIRAGDLLPRVDLRELAAEPDQVRPAHVVDVVGDVLPRAVSALHAGRCAYRRKIVRGGTTGQPEQWAITLPGREEGWADVREEQHRSAVQPASPFICNMRAELRP